MDKGLRSERALKIAIAQMCVQGVSTRKVSVILEKMCGLDVSTQFSNAAKLLDDELEKWRNRPIGNIPFLAIGRQVTYLKYVGLWDYQEIPFTDTNQQWMKTDLMLCLIKTEENPISRTE